MRIMPRPEHDIAWHDTIPLERLFLDGCGLQYNRQTRPVSLDHHRAPTCECEDRTVTIYTAKLYRVYTSPLADREKQYVLVYGWPSTRRHTASILLSASRHWKGKIRDTRPEVVNTVTFEWTAPVNNVNLRAPDWTFRTEDTSRAKSYINPSHSIAESSIQVRLEDHRLLPADSDCAFMGTASIHLSNSIIKTRE